MMNNDKVNVDHRQNEKFQYVFELTEIEWCINFTPLDRKRRKESKERLRLRLLEYIKLFDFLLITK